MSEAMNSTSVVLEIENKSIVCDKAELTKHSDYFKVMFEGNFVERNKSIVKLEGIDFNSMNIILKLLWDPDYTIKDEDLLSVLQASCMLQFVEIKGRCIEKFINQLSPTNCLNIWLLAEQLDITQLSLKAKRMALLEFNVVKNTDDILDLNLKQLYTYLANVDLVCTNELDVFQACMKWWYENSEKFSESVDEDHFESFCKETFLCLLSCLNYNNMSKSDIQEIMTYPDISDNEEIMEILRCIINLKEGVELKSSNEIITRATSLNNSRPRIFKTSPCIFVDTLVNENRNTKKQKYSSDNVPIIYYDAFKRKRYYSNIKSSESTMAIIYYDQESNKLIKFLDIDKNKCGNLDGFKIIGYKEFIFLVGGEFLIGKGNWNKNLWVYNTVSECWQRKSVPSLMRRHFEACICGDNLYIIGGTGKFRVLQDSMICYNITEDKLGEQVNLPCPGINSKCCSWRDKPLIINLSERNGYVFDSKRLSWRKLIICDDEHLVPSYPDVYCVFSYKDKICIKGNGIIEMKLQDNKLIVTNYISLVPVLYNEISSVVCHNILYTLYREICYYNTISSSVTFEKYDLDLHIQNFILEEVNEHGPIQTENGVLIAHFLPNLSQIHQRSYKCEDKFINDYQFTLPLQFV